MSTCSHVFLRLQRSAANTHRGSQRTTVVRTGEKLRPHPTGKRSAGHLASDTSGLRPNTTQQLSSPIRDRQTESKSIPAELPPYLQDLYRTDLLNAEQERQLFRQLARLKQMVTEYEMQDTGLTTVRSGTSVELKQLKYTVVEVRNAIVEANLRLVVSVAKKFSGAGRPDLTELVSEGNSILIRAVDLFDVEYGTRFSTYATTALTRGFVRVLKLDQRHRQRFLNGQSELVDASQETVADPEVLARATRLAKESQQFLSQLDDRERLVVERRFGFVSNAKRQTFAELGKVLGISKERVRQILHRSLLKMRAVAHCKP